MPLSRLRFRLTLRFAGAYLVGLLALDLALYGYLRERAAHRLTRDLDARATALIAAVHQEFADEPDSGLQVDAREVMREWKAPPGAYQILDTLGRPLATRDPDGLLAAWDGIPLDSPVRVRRLPEGRPYRRVVARSDSGPPFRVVVVASAGAVAEDDERLAWWLGLSAVALLLLGLGGGYILSRGALAPMDELGDAIARISPTSLGARLPVADPPDEVDRLRAQFNALFARLEEAQSQNRRFLREAAHQIRTPLTLVMGEASLALSGSGGDPETLRRIQRAAEQMQHRVDDLFLLAEAQAGATPALDERVDLEELVLEAADAMRARAHQLGRRLAFGSIAPVMVTGHRGLLREAMLELLENAVRHGGAEAPIEIALDATPSPRIAITSLGPPFVVDAAVVPPTGEVAHHGLGLTIVRWIAELHHGVLAVESAGGANRVTLTLPPG